MNAQCNFSSAAVEAVKVYSCLRTAGPLNRGRMMPQEGPQEGRVGPTLIVTDPSAHLAR